MALFPWYTIFFDKSFATHIATGINSDAVLKNQPLPEDLHNLINKTQNIFFV